jgi:hypothetical protein
MIRRPIVNSQDNHGEVGAVTDILISYSRKDVAYADSLLFIFSPDSVDSEYCQTELAFATENNKRLILV